MDSLDQYTNCAGSVNVFQGESVLLHEGNMVKLRWVACSCRLYDDVSPCANDICIDQTPHPTPLMVTSDQILLTNGTGR